MFTFWLATYSTMPTSIMSAYNKEMVIFSTNFGYLYSSYDPCFGPIAHLLVECWSLFSSQVDFLMLLLVSLKLLPGKCF